MSDIRILVVDDEEDLCEILKYNLENEGFWVDTANSAEEALKLNLTDYSLLLLDVMMGEISGFKMASMLKKDKATATIPIIFMRVKAVLRRTVEAQSAQPDVLTYRGLSMDIAQKRVTINGEDVSLTKKEIEILKLLLKSPGKVFSREDILTKIWSDEVYVLDRTVDVNITRLRKKIGDYGTCIITRLGYGYCFDDK